MVVLDAPLLFESKADLLCKHVIVVHCKEETQLARRVSAGPAPLLHPLHSHSRICHF